MSRYLTPAKLCTLLLVEAYLNNAHTNPDHGSQILSLVTSILLSHNDLSSSSQQPPGPPIDALSFSEPLSSIPSDFPGRSYRDDFVAKLWATASLDDLQTFFERLQSLLQPAKPEDRRISPGSPTGHFVRRSIVEWTRLPFQSSLALLNAFTAYLEPSWSALLRRDPETARLYLLQHQDADGQALVPGASSNTAASESRSSAVSTGDVEAALSHSVYLLQNRGRRIPPELRERLRTWLASSTSQDQGVQSLHHFLCFFESWRAGQYNQALENLHRYFDYSLASKSAPDNGNTDANGSLKLYYQYALLHLSVLHADFERWEESLNAMEECVATARESQDTVCLSFALSWLLYLRQASSASSFSSSESGGRTRSLAALAGEGGSEHDELAFLKQKAKESKHWSLVSGTLLEEAKLDSRQGGVTPKSLESVFQAAHLNVQHANFSLMPATSIFMGGILERLGQTHGATRYYDSTSVSTNEHNSLPDHVRTQCRFSFSLAKNGQYDLARKMLSDLRAEVTGTLKLEQRVEAFGLLVALLQSIRRENFAAANSYLALLRPMRTFSDPEIANQIDLLDIAAKKKRGWLDLALEKTNALISRSNSHNADDFGRGASADIAHHLHLMVVKASIFSEAGHPRKGFSVAVRAAATSERLHLLPVVLEAFVVLGSILNDMGEFEGAKALAEAGLPLALEAPSSVELSADLFNVLIDAHAGLANPALEANSASSTSSTGRHGSTQHKNQHPHLAIRNAERAHEAYARLQDHAGQASALAKKARMALYLGDEASAKEAESRYEQLLSDHDLVE